VSQYLPGSIDCFTLRCTDFAINTQSVVAATEKLEALRGALLGIATLVTNMIGMLKESDCQMN